MKQSGFFWHMDHEVLVGWCYSYDQHARHIRTNKPNGEQGLRLRLFQPVTGQLPQEVFWALKECDRAKEAFDEAEEAVAVEWDDAFDEAVRVSDRRRGLREEAKKAYIEALANHKDEIEALHARECRNCCWDGKTIFPTALTA